MDKEKEIEKLKALLLEKCSSVYVEPVLTDENGNEYKIIDKKALKVLDDILEQAFIPYVAEQIINAGYRKGEVISFQAGFDAQENEKIKNIVFEFARKLMEQFKEKQWVGATNIVFYQLMDFKKNFYGEVEQ